MWFKKILIGILFFSVLNADYSVTQGNSSSKISFDTKQCSSGASGFLKNILSSQHYTKGRAYASVSSGKIKFYYNYPSYNGNNGFKVKFYISDSNKKIYTRSNFTSTLRDNGGTKSFISSKDYDGNYYIGIALVDTENSSNYCALLNKNNPIKIEQITPIPKLNYVSVDPNSNEAGKKFTFKAGLSQNLPSGYKVEVNYGTGYKGMSCSNKYCYKNAYPTIIGVNKAYTIRILDGNGNRKDSDGGTYIVTKATSTLPTISSLDESSFQATDNWQYLHINGTNLSNAVVYMDYDDNVGFRKQTQGITYQSSSKITFKFRTTKSGSGTWKVKVKNSDGYSNYKTFNVKKTVTIPSTPTLKSPSNNATLNGTTQTLDWYSVSGATGYELALRDATLNRWIYGGSKSTKKTTNSEATVSGLTEGHKYAWTVQAKNSAGLSNDSSVRYFTIKKTITKPSTPTLKSPSNNATLNGTTQTLSWYSVSRAEKYEIYLRDETTNNWIFSDSGEKKVTGTSVSYSGFKEGHTYQWNLKALNSAGYSGLSSTYKFTIKKTPVKINGSCGTADNHKYPANTTSFGSFTQCSSGRADPTTFSIQSDNTVSWHCLGENGGVDVLCMASVEKAPDPINGECGTANNHTFLANNTSYGTYTQCKKGVANPTKFPSQGSKQTWVCEGQNGGSNANCSASREAKSEETIKLKIPYYLPVNARVNADVTFYAPLTETLPKNMKVFLKADDIKNEVEMQCQGRECRYTTSINKVRKNAHYTVYLRKISSNSQQKASSTKALRKFQKTYNNSIEIDRKIGAYTVVEGKIAYTLKFKIYDDDSRVYYNDEVPNFNAQFSIKNESNGNDSVLFDKMAIAILDENGKFIKNCWERKTPYTLPSEAGFYDSAKQECHIENSGQYIAVVRLYEHGKDVKELIKKTFHINSRLDDNQLPIINQTKPSNNELKKGDSFSLEVEAMDIDGKVKEVDIDWNDGNSKTEVIKTDNTNVKVSASHTFNNYGTFTWTTRAYDDFLSKDKTSNHKYSGSVMKTGNVYVYDKEYYQKPTLDIINHGEIKANRNTVILTLTGTNFSQFSRVHWKSPADEGYYKSLGKHKSTEIKIPIYPDPNESGKWYFYVENKGGVSTTRVVTVKPAEKLEVYNISKLKTFDIVSGSKIQINIKGKGSNLKKICYRHFKNSDISSTLLESKCIDAKSGETKTLTFSPVYSEYSNKDYSIDTIRVWVADNNKESNKIDFKFKIYNQKKFHYAYINDVNRQKAGQCGGLFTVKKNGAVNTASGAEMFSLNLMKVQGLHTISSVLSYNSLLLTDNSISRGWNHNYGFSASLDFLDEEKRQIRLNWQNGNYNDFNLTSENTYTSTDTTTKFTQIVKNSDGTFSFKLPNGMRYQFYEDGHIKAVENKLGQGINISFDTNGTLRRVSDALSGVALEYEYNEQGKLSKIIDPQLNRETLLSYNSKGFLSKIETPANIEYYFNYNEIGQITQMSYGDGTVYFTNTYLENGLIETEDDGRYDNHIFEYSFDFSEKGKIKSTYVNGEGDATTYLYDSKDFLLYKITDALGNEIINEYNQTTRELIKTTNAKKESTSFAYDSKGRLVKEVFANGLVKEMKYDDNDNLISEKSILSDKTSYETIYTYGSNNTLLSKKMPNGDTYRYSYNSNKQLIESISPSGAKTTYSYENGRVSKVVYPKGNSINYTYDEAGRLISETVMPLNATTTYSYDDADRLIQVTDALNNSVNYGYDMRGNKIYSVDALNHTTKYEYDAKNNLLKTIYPDNTETTYEYDGEDRVKTITYANGATNKFEYDALGRVTKQIDAMGNFVEFTYDALGNVLQKVDRDGNVIANYKYDTMQKVVEAVDYFNNKVTNKYNQLGLLEQTTDPLGRVNKFKYDKLGRLTEAVDALNGISKQSFDKEGNTKEFTDPNSNKTELKHDEVGNLTEIKTASGSTTKYEYDANGLLTKETNGRGQERSYSYNKNGQLKTIKDDVGTITYTYDDNGNPTSIDENGKKITMVYDEMNRLVSYTDTMGNTIGYAYDSVGNLKTLTYPDGKTVEYSYNLANQLTKVKDWNNHITTYEYDTHGRMVKQTYPNGAVLTRTYDNGGRLTSQKEFLSQYDRISEYAYEYDKVGNILKERTYPQISPKALASLQMSYAKGNLLKEANQTVPTFDKDDNMLSFGSLALGYDSRNRLTKANGVSYVYDAQNNRLSKTVGGKKTTYITNPNASLSQVLVKTDADGSKTYYVYGLGLLSQTKGSETLYYHYDLRGSTIALSDDTKDYPTIADRFSYAPYGKLLTHTGSHDTPFLFVGKHGVMQEENELVYMRARYYHESLRRFVNRDTLIGEVGDFGSLNRFEYVEGLVTGNIDPTGHNPLIAAIAVVIWEAFFNDIPQVGDNSTGETVSAVGLPCASPKSCGVKGGKKIIKSCKKIFSSKKKNILKNIVTYRKFKGRTTIQNDALINREFIDNKGRNYIDRMREGLAPIGIDGKPLNLHHSKQDDKVWIELTQEKHNKHDKILHGYRTESIINRKSFNKLRREYWKQRANDFSLN